MTSEGLNTSKDYALCYHDMGFSVFVLQNPDSEGRTIEQLKARKKPAVKWELYQIMRPSKIQIERWYSKNKKYNLALVMGGISGNAIGFDVDGTGAQKKMEEIRMKMSTNLRVAFDNTMYVRSGGGGIHIIFRVIDGLIDDISQEELWTDGDEHSQILLQGNGHYLATAPSRHPNNKIYEWNEREPSPLTRKELDELIGLLRPTPVEQQYIPQDRHISEPGEERSLTLEQTQELLNWVKPYYLDGTRDHMIFYLSGMMRKENFSLASAVRFFTLLCNSSGFSDEDLDKSLQVVQNTYAKPINELNGRAGLHKLLVTSYQSTNEIEHTRRADHYSQICQILNPQPFLPPHSLQEQQRGEEEDDDDDNTYNDDEIILDSSPGAWLRRQKQADKFLDINDILVKEILRRCKYRTFIDTKEIVWENGGVFVKGGEEHIKKVLEDLGGSKIKEARRNEIIQRIKIITYTEREEFDKDPLLRNVKNGIVDLMTGERFPHDPDNYPSLIQIPHNYYTAAEMKEILAMRPKGSQMLCKKVVFEYLCNVLAPQDIILSIEFWGYDLIGDNTFQKALMNTGPPDAGKSTHVDITEAFLGKKNCANKTLKELTVNRFAKADLYGKLANTCADISNSKLDDIETFKMLVSGDDISAEKKRKDPFDFTPRCKLHFSANTPPLPQNETDEAFYKRWVLPNFAMKKKQFLDKTKDVVINRNLVQEIIADENELSDLLYLAVQAAGKILRQGGFSGGARTNDINKIMEEYMRKARPTIAWVEDNCVIGAQYEGDKNRLFTDFRDYCKKHRLPSINTIIGLARELRGLYHIDDSRPGRRKDKRPHLWKGICLIKDLRPEEQTEILGEPKYE